MRGADVLLRSSSPTIRRKQSTFSGFVRDTGSDSLFCRPISSFPLSVLPETGPDSTCLDALNYVSRNQLSRIRLVCSSSLSVPTRSFAHSSRLDSEYPRSLRCRLWLTSCIDARKGRRSDRSSFSRGCHRRVSVAIQSLASLELILCCRRMIGEEIIDETDLYVDIHNKIKVVRGPTKRIAAEKALAPLIQGQSFPTYSRGGSIENGARVDVVICRRNRTTKDPPNRDRLRKCDSAERHRLRHLHTQHDAESVWKS